MTRGTFLLVAALVAPPAFGQSFDAHLFVVTTDYSVSGNTVAMALEAPFSAVTNLEPVGADPVVRYANGRHYVVNRFLADNIQVIDANDFRTRAEFSVGPTTNPHDILVLDDTRAYVSRYERTQLLLVNPATGALLDSLDLAPFADADGLPEMSMMARAGDRLFVQLARLDRPGGWGPAGAGALAVVDVTSNTLVDADPATAGVQPIALAGANPQGKMHVDESTGTLFVACAGVLGAWDGGVERVDLLSLRSDGWVLREEDVDGDVGAFVMRGAACFVLVSDDYFFDTRLLRFEEGTAEPALLFERNAFLPAILHDPVTDHVFVADRTPSAPGVHVFDGASGERLTPNAISTGLPPVDMAIARGVAPLLPPERPIARVAPNPWRTDATISIDVVTSGRHRVRLFDVHGRLVHAFPALAGDAGTTLELHLDGQDDLGRSLRSGVYWVDVRGPARADRVRAVLIR